MNMRTESISNVGLRSESKSFYLSKGHTIGVPRNSHTLLTETHDSVGITLKDAGQRFVKSRNLAKDLGGKAARPLLPVGQNKAGASGTSSESTNKPASQTKPMGGEGTPIKSKTPLGQTSATDNKADFVSMNSHNSRDSGGEDSTKGFETMGAHGVASHEHTEGKRNNMRKTSSHPSSQANCLHQLLLLQLDLIEQQQQQLQSKDKEIDELKADRDTVCGGFYFYLLSSYTLASES